MRLYEVINYSELYYKALRKPVFRPVKVPFERPADEYMSEFVEEVLPMAEVVSSTLWTPDMEWRSDSRFEGESTFASYANWEGLMKEILRQKYYAEHPIVFEHWEAYRSAWKNWVASPTKSMAEWEAVKVTWRATWGRLHPDDRKFWAAKNFWEAVRARPVWKELHRVALMRYEKSFPGFDWNKAAGDSADFSMRRFMKGKMSFAEFNKALGMRSVTDYIIKVTGPYLVAGVTILKAVFLPLVAAAGLLLLVINPASQGVRKKNYRGSRLLMRYNDRVWWADMIGKSAKGYGVYKRCEEVKAFMVTRRIVTKKPRFDVEHLLVYPEEVGTVKKGWWYWVSWPWSFDVRFHGYLVQKAGDIYALKESWRWAEVVPVELHKDAWGKISQRVASWYDEREGVPCIKDSRRWCMEEDLPEWILFEGRVPV